MPEPKTGSLRALDALNFCNAGIQTGLGPFMAIFYTSVRHWNPGQIGTLIATSGVFPCRTTFSRHGPATSRGTAATSSSVLLTGVAGLRVPAISLANSGRARSLSSHAAMCGCSRANGYPASDSRNA